MTAIEALLAKPIIQALGWALLHFIWQGAIIAALYALVKAFLRKSAPNSRYAAACSALALMLAAPLITLFIMSRSPADIASIPSMNEASISVDASLVVAPVPAGQPGPETSIDPQSAAAASSPSAPMTVGDRLRELIALYMPWLLALWFAGVLFFSLKFAGGLLVVRKFRPRQAGPVLMQWQEKIPDLAKRLRVSRPVRLYESLIVEVPMVVGWLRPVILLPASALTGLSAAQIEALLAHELAHVRRYDYLINLLQTAIETLLFYHPAVWWVSGEIREEREHCCDDLAVAACGDVLVYARALAELEQIRIVAPRLAVGATGGSLLRRIQRLIGRPARASHRFESGLAGLMALAAILFVVAGAYTPMLTGSATAEASGLSVTAQRPQPGSFDGEMAVAAGLDQKSFQRAESAPPESDPGNGALSKAADPEQATAVEAEPADAGQEDNDQAAPRDFIGSMTALGYENLSVDELNALDAHRVSPDFVREANDLLNLKLSVPQLVAFRVHGVTPGVIKEFKAAGQTDLNAERLVAFKVHGVTPQLIADMKALGYDNLSADKLTAFRVHGVSTDFVRTIKVLGFDNVSAEGLIAMRVHGVSPEFVQWARGYVGGDLSISQLTAFRIHGVSVEYVKELESLGYSNLSAGQLIGARVHGVSPKFISAVQSFGFKPTFDQLMQMRIHGVTPDFIEAVKGRGFNDVTIAQLIELRRLNIIPGSRKKE